MNVPLLFLDIAAKSVFVLLSAALLCLALRRSPAAARHGVWTAAMVGLLCLPALCVAVPGWSIRILPAVSHPNTLLLDPSAIPKLARDHAGALADRSASQDVVCRERQTASGSPTVLSEPANRIPSAVATKAAMRRNSFAIDRHAVSNALWLFWSLGAVLCLARTLTGLTGAFRLIRRSVPVDCPIAEAGARELAVGRAVAVRVGASRVPMTCGDRHPAILLPRDFGEWPSERLRSVVLHELAHIRRRDWLILLLAQVVCAVYWFYPLVWIAYRRLRLEAERACDDLVLGLGVSPVDYARHLLMAARGLTERDGRMAAAMMARPSELAQRMTAILGACVARRGVTPGERALCAFLLLCAAGLSLAHLAPRLALRAAAAIPPALAARLDLIQTLVTGDGLNCIAFTPDGARLLTGSAEASSAHQAVPGGRLAVWSVGSGKQLSEHSLSQPLTAVAYSPDGRLLATAYAGGELRLSDSRTGRTLRSIPLSMNAVADLQFSPDSLTLAASDRDGGSPILLDTRTGKLCGPDYRGIFRRVAHRSARSGFAVVPESWRLVTWGPQVTLWSPRWHTPTITLDTRAEVCAARGRFLAVKEGNEVQLWDTASRTRLAVDIVPDSGPSPHLAFSPDGKYLAFGGSHAIKVWRIAGA